MNKCSREDSAVSRSATLGPSVRKDASTWTENSTLSKWILHCPTTCGMHCPFAVAVVSRPVFQRPHSHSVPYRFVVSVSPASATTPQYPEIIADLFDRSLSIESLFFTQKELELIQRVNYLQIVSLHIEVHASTLSLSPVVFDLRSDSRISVSSKYHLSNFLFLIFRSTSVCNVDSTTLRPTFALHKLRAWYATSMHQNFLTSIKKRQW